MWKCHKCGKPVYFAERKQSLGYDWHPECLRCEECGKRLNPGQHAEHKGVPYCHVPCYGALFGPQLFGHGTRVESHTSFGKVENRTGIPNLPRSHLESKLKLFNQYYEGKSGKVHCREVNGRLVLEGALRIYWGVVGVIHLKEEYDQRTVVTVRKRNSYRFSNGINVNRYYNGKNKGAVSVGSSASCSSSSTSSPVSSPMSSPVNSPHVSPTHPSKVPPDSSRNTALFEYKSSTLPAKLDLKNIDWDELDDLLQVERQVEEGEKLYQTMPVGLHSVSSPEPFESSSSSTPRAPLTAQSSTESAELPLDNVDYTAAESAKGSNAISKESNNIAIDKIDSPKNENQAINQSDDDTDSYSKCFEDSVESDKRMSRSQSMPPDYNGDGDIWGDDDADDDESDMNDHPLDRSTSVPESNLSSSSSGLGDSCGSDNQCRRKAAKTGSAAIRRRPGRRRSRTKLRRRCSINGHFYDRETSFFTPPHGSSTSVWVTSLVSTQEVVNLMLDKYRVDSKPDNFALFVVYDNGEQRRLREDEYPLVTRILLGPHEDVARIFIVDRHSTSEVSNEVAQFLNLSVTECSAILEGYQREEERQLQAVQSRYKELRKRIKQRMEELKVRL